MARILSITNDTDGNVTSILLLSFKNCAYLALGNRKCNKQNWRIINYCDAIVAEIIKSSEETNFKLLNEIHNKI